MEEKSLAEQEKTVLVMEKEVAQKIQPPVDLLPDQKSILPQNGHHSNPDKPKTSLRSIAKQILAAFVAQLGTVNTGMAFGFSAIAIPQLRAANSIIPITEVEESWIASISSIGTPIGCLLSGYLMDVLGRKRSLVMTQVPALLGWLLISFAINLEMIYTGRFLVGLGSGMVGAPSRVYTSEVTQPHLRGMLIAMASIGVSTGVLVEYAMGSVMTWKLCAAVSGLIPASALILILIYPETPTYLISRNKPDEAMKALEYFRSTSDNRLISILLQHFSALFASFPPSLPVFSAECAADDLSLWSPPLAADSPCSDWAATCGSMSGGGLRALIRPGPGFQLSASSPTRSPALWASSSFRGS